MPRQSEFTQAKADIICERLSGGESLSSICRDANMPSCVTVFKWLAANPAFANGYARAREAQADAIFDECLDIADDARNDWMEKRGHLIPNNEVAQRSRLRIDTRKWMAGKLRPKKYGEKIDHTHAGPDGGPVETKQTIIYSGVLAADDENA